ncbi:MAG: homoserine dehydrogenase [Caldicoprobacterales bacterium]|nr:homoserine dehydrogenase [Clostridiales bacterium]
MDIIRIGLLGLGNVGSGVMNILRQNINKIREYAGVHIEIEKVLVRDINKPRDIVFDEQLLTTNPQDILDNPDIDIVVELIGGIEPAFSYIKQAMVNGKHVVTANKAVIATYCKELFELADKNNVEIRFEGSVGGGIPLIDTITNKLAGNQIDELVGIINGTTNYILSRMSREGMSFEAALKKAQQKGYAEADPSSDIEGQDAIYKLAILAAISFGLHVSPQDIPCEGITRISEHEIRYAEEIGYAVKLLATARNRDGKLEIHVHPSLIPNHHPLAAVHDEFNALFIKGNAVGELMLYGKGAGSMPTGSAVIGDILDIIKMMRQSAKTGSSFVSNGEKLKVVGEESGSYYIRLQVVDKPGVLGIITTTLGKHDISIASVAQQGMGQELVPVIFITHEVEREKLDRGLDEIRKLSHVVGEVACILRVESY